MLISDWISDVCSSDLFSLNTFRNEVPDSLDAQMINDTKAVFERGEKMQLTYTVRNTHRAVGTRLSARITEKFGMSTLADGHVHVRLRGSAGQSLGAFLCKGIWLEVLDRKSTRLNSSH